MGRRDVSRDVREYECVVTFRIIITSKSFMPDLKVVL